MKWAIHHVTFPTHDAEASAAFYRDVLGLDVGEPHTIGKGAVAFDGSRKKVDVVGNRNRGVHLVVGVPDLAERAGIGINPSLGVHMAIEVADLDRVRRGLKEANVYFVDVGEKFISGMPQIYVYDPAGNLIEINQEADTTERLSQL